MVVLVKDLHPPSSQLDSLTTFRLQEPVIISFSICLNPDFYPANNAAATAGVRCARRRVNPGRGEMKVKVEFDHISSTWCFLSAGLNGKPVCVVNDDWYGFTPLCPHPLIKSQVSVSRSAAFLTPEVGSARSGPRAGTDNTVTHT